MPEPLDFGTQLDDLERRADELRDQVEEDVEEARRRRDEFEDDLQLPPPLASQPSKPKGSALPWVLAAGVILIVASRAKG